MEHLNLETLARLLDEPPHPDERKHLEACDDCLAELRALREQTEALASLPEIVPPLGDWDVLEAQLRSEGLVRDPGLLDRLGLMRTPAWVPAAASLVLFLGGVAVGSGITPGGDVAVADEQLASTEGNTMEAAATDVRRAEEDYVSAVSRYREVMAREGVDDNVVDPVSRYAILEHLVSASQAAVRQAPGDVFLNGLLASTLAERDATARMVSASQDNWF